MSGVRPASVKVSTPAPVVVIRVPSRRTSYPVTATLSVDADHDNDTDVDVVVAARPPGVEGATLSTGAGSVVTLNDAGTDALAAASIAVTV